MHVLGACDVTYVFRNYLDHFCSFCEMGASEAIATIHNAHYHNLHVLNTSVECLRSKRTSPIRYTIYGCTAAAPGF